MRKAQEWEKFAHEVEASRSDKLQIIEANERTIRRLKAQIYDLNMEARAKRAQLQQSWQMGAKNGRHRRPT